MNIYLNFDGNCRDVFEHYQSIFGGEFEAYQTFADGPPDMGVAPEFADQIMHVSLKLGDSSLMGSDTFPGMPLTAGNNFSIVVPANSRAECDRLFEALSAGGGRECACAVGVVASRLTSVSSCSSSG